MISAPAHAKINLALVVGPTRPDGLHEVATILQRLELADTISLEPAAELVVEGFEGDTIVRAALVALAVAAGAEPSWRVRIDKRIPVAAGLGGGSSDAATALRLAGDLLGDLPPGTLEAIARDLGVDVAFFLDPGPKLGTGDGTTLEPLELPRDYSVLLVLPYDEAKHSTGEVYFRFDRAAGFDERREAVISIAAAGRSADLAALPPNDLARSPIGARLRGLGAFRADVSGAGPTVYGLFRDRGAAEQAAQELQALGQVWITTPAW
jgi:4-diphosphocytidyl-2-C-methyl-D-erythritol kinase